jgi:hypothetical protein
VRPWPTAGGQISAFSTIRAVSSSIQPDSSNLPCSFFSPVFRGDAHFRNALFPTTRRKTLRAVSLTLALLGTGVASAIPPAPYYTLYGEVRDQVGQTVTAEGAEAILLKGGGEVGHTPITPSQVDRKYELNIRLDQNRSNTAFYTDKANAASGSAAGNVLLGCWEFMIPTFAKNKLKKTERNPI